MTHEVDTSALTSALAKAKQRYADANPLSAAAFADAKSSGIAGGTNRASIFYKPFPLTFVDAKAATAVTADGQLVTDFLGNYTAGLFGFSPQPVIDAVTRAMANGHALGGAPNTMEARVAKALVGRFNTMDMVRFSNTGSEANTYAMNTARAVTGRSKILMYSGAYHGAWIHGGDLALDIPYEKILVPYGDADQICEVIHDNADDLAAIARAAVIVATVAPRPRLPRACVRTHATPCQYQGSRALRKHTGPRCSEHHQPHSFGARPYWPDYIERRVYMTNPNDLREPVDVLSNWQLEYTLAPSPATEAASSPATCCSSP